MQVKSSCARGQTLSGVDVYCLGVPVKPSPTRDPRHVGRVVRSLRRAKGWSQMRLAQAAGLHLNTVSAYELEARPGTERATLGKLATALGYTEGEVWAMVPLLDDEGALPLALAGRPPVAEAERLSLDVYDGYVKNDLPIIAEGEASPQGALFWDAAEGRPLIEADEWTSRPFDLKDPRAYAIKVRGDSMRPVFTPGMLLIVSPNAPVKARGDNAYVQLHNGERLVKYVRKQQGGWILESHNSAYDTRFVPTDEVGTLHRIVYAKF